MKRQRYPERDELKALDTRLRGHDEINTPMPELITDYVYLLTFLFSDFLRFSDTRHPKPGTQYQIYRKRMTESKPVTRNLQPETYPLFHHSNTPMIS